MPTDYLAPIGSNANAGSKPATSSGSDLANSLLSTYTSPADQANADVAAKLASVTPAANSNAALVQDIITQAGIAGGSQAGDPSTALAQIVADAGALNLPYAPQITDAATRMMNYIAFGQHGVATTPDQWSGAATTLQSLLGSSLLSDAQAADATNAALAQAAAANQAALAAAMTAHASSSTPAGSSSSAPAGSSGGGLPAVVVGGSSAPLAPSVSTIPSIQVLSTPHVSAPAPASTPNVSTPAPASTPNTSTGAPSWQTWALIGGAVAGMGLFAIALHEKANGGRNKN